MVAVDTSSPVPDNSNQEGRSGTNVLGAYVYRELTVTTLRL